MEHATALVDHDATTPTTCGCQRLVDAGWQVRCYACGRDSEAAAPALLALVYRPNEHTCRGFCDACGDERAASEADWESLVEHDVDLVEAYDELRDEILVDAADRRVA